MWDDVTALLIWPLCVGLSSSLALINLDITLIIWAHETVFDSSLLRDHRAHRAASLDEPESSDNGFLIRFNEAKLRDPLFI